MESFWRLLGKKITQVEEEKSRRYGKGAHWLRDGHVVRAFDLELFVRRLSSHSQPLKVIVSGSLS